MTEVLESFREKLTNIIRRLTGAYEPDSKKRIRFEDRPTTEQIERAERLRQQDGAAGSPSANSHAATDLLEKKKS
jgi:hypothetical protein